MLGAILKTKIMIYNYRTKIVHQLIRNGFECLNPCNTVETSNGVFESFQLLTATDMPDYFCDNETKLISIISEEGLNIIDRYLRSPHVRLYPDPLENTFIKNSKL